jgi:flavin-binding protein dodecin
MSADSHTYAISEIVGTSHEGISQAVDNGLATASKTLRNLDWFEIKEIRGNIVDNKVGHYQVTMKLGFRYDE